MICPDCGGEFKNLGAHQRFCKGAIDGLGITVDEYITEQPLSSIISDMEGILKKISHSMSVLVNKDNGTTKDVEITVRFQIRR